MSPSPQFQEPTASDSSSAPLYPFVAQVTDDELDIFAAEMARCFGFVVEDARLAHVSFYRGFVGRDTCSHPRAAELKAKTIARCYAAQGENDVCPNPSAEGGRGESPEQGAGGGVHPFRPLFLAANSLRDFGRRRVGADDEGHRRRRTQLMASLPARRDAGVFDISAAIDADFDEACRENEQREEEKLAQPFPPFLWFRVGLLVAALLLLWRLMPRA